MEKTYTWTPDEGPLSKAVKKLSDLQVVKVHIQNDIVHFLVRHTDSGVEFTGRFIDSVYPDALKATSAEWRVFEPSWATPELPLVVRLSDNDSVYYVRGNDGCYSYRRDGMRWTVNDIDKAGDVVVVYDANGQYLDDI